MPNGPEWIDVYRKIQDAGKAVHIDIEAKYVKELAKKLDVSFLYIVTRIESVQEAKELFEWR